MENKTIITAEKQNAVRKLLRFKGSNFVYFMVTEIVALIAALVMFFIYRTKSQPMLSTIIPIILILFMAAYFVYYLLKTGSFRQTGGESQIEMNYTFEQNVIIVHHGDQKMSLSYSRITEVFKTEGFYVLCISKSDPMLIAIRGFFDGTSSDFELLCEQKGIRTHF